MNNIFGLLLVSHMEISNCQESFPIPIVDFRKGVFISFFKVTKQFIVGKSRIAFHLSPVKSTRSKKLASYRPSISLKEFGSSFSVYLLLSILTGFYSG